MACGLWLVAELILLATVCPIHGDCRVLGRQIQYLLISAVVRAPSK